MSQQTYVIVHNNNGIQYAVQVSNKIMDFVKF